MLSATPKVWKSTRLNSPSPYDMPRSGARPAGPSPRPRSKSAEAERSVARALPRAVASAAYDSSYLKGADGGACEQTEATIPAYKERHLKIKKKRCQLTRRGRSQRSRRPPKTARWAHRRPPTGSGATVGMATGPPRPSPPSPHPCRV